MQSVSEKFSGMRGTQMFLATTVFCFSVCAFFSAHSSTLQARELPRDKKGVPQIKAWLKRVQGSDQGDLRFQTNFGKIIFVDAWDGLHPKLINFDRNDFNRRSMFKALGGEDLAFILSVNNFGSAPAAEGEKGEKGEKEEKGEKSKTKILADISAMSDASLIVEKVKGTESDLRLIDAKRQKVLFKGRGLAKFDDPRKIHSWLVKVLGYHGVVIDTQDDFVLVTASEGLYSAKDLNSLILADSIEKAVIKPKDRKGLSLLQLESWLGKYAVFRTLIKEDEIPIGSKVLIEVKSDASDAEKKSE